MKLEKKGGKYLEKEKAICCKGEENGGGVVFFGISVSISYLLFLTCLYSFGNKFLDLTKTTPHTF